MQLYNLRLFFALLCLLIEFANWNGRPSIGNSSFVYACTGRWEVRYHIGDYAEKIKMVAV